MATKKTLVEIEHDTHYSGMLLAHINRALDCSDINAKRVLNGVAPCYENELWPIDKTLIYNAISALASALGYMPKITTDVPSWQRALDQDVAKMELVLIELRKLGVPVDTSKPQA